MLLKFNVYLSIIWIMLYFKDILQDAFNHDYIQYIHYLVKIYRH